MGVKKEVKKIEIYPQVTAEDVKNDTLHIEGNVDQPMYLSADALFVIRCQFADITNSGKTIHYWYSKNGKLYDDYFQVPVIKYNSGKNTACFTLTFDVYCDNI